MPPSPTHPPTPLPCTSVVVTQVFTLHSSLHLIGEPTAVGRLDQLLGRFLSPTPSKQEAQAAQDVVDCFWLKLGDKVMFNRLFFEDHQPPGHLAMGNASGPYPQGWLSGRLLMCCLPQ